MPDKMRTLAIVSIGLLLLFAALVLGGVSFAGATKGGSEREYEAD